MLLLCSKVELPNLQIVTSLPNTRVVSVPHTTKSGPGSNYINMYIYLTANYKTTWICTQTLQSPTLSGQHNHPHTVRLSASKTKHIYIHINNPECVPTVCWRPASRLPLGQQQQSVIPNQWVSYSAVSLCTVLGSQEFFLQGPGERRASQITPYQFIGSGGSRFRVSFIVYWATEQTARIGQIHRSLHRSMYGSVGQSVLEENTVLLKLASFSLCPGKGFTFIQY